MRQLYLAVKVACHRLQLGQKQLKIFTQGTLHRLVRDHDLSLQAVAGNAPLILLRVPWGEHLNAFTRLNLAGEVLHQALRERHDCRNIRQGGEAIAIAHLNSAVTRNRANIPTVLARVVDHVGCHE